MNRGEVYDLIMNCLIGFGCISWALFATNFFSAIYLSQIQIGSFNELLFRLTVICFAGGLIMWVNKKVDSYLKDGDET